MGPLVTSARRGTVIQETTNGGYTGSTRSSKGTTLTAAHRQLLRLLLGGAHKWARREPVDLTLLETIRRRALLLNHDRYVAAIPAYRRLAEESGLESVSSLRDVIRELVMTGDIFKSYDAAWLEGGDFERMTEWLGGIFVARPRPDLSGVDGVAAWRSALQHVGVFVTHSSGTSGRPSFVPRDAMTLSALRGNGRFYMPPLWEDREQAAFDCLVLGSDAIGTGMQGAATGLAGAASRAHFLFGPQGEAASDREAAFEEAFRFLRRAVAERVRVLVFGAPFEVQELCARLPAQAGSLELPATSVVLTGGGWKRGEPLERTRLVDEISEALHVPPPCVVDAYSTSEINGTLLTCPRGGYHVPPVLEPILLDEFLQEVREPVAAGMLGFLDPFAFSYPGFVATGDDARLVREPCGCGLTGAWIAGEIQRAARQEEKGCAGVAAPVDA